MGVLLTVFCQALSAVLSQPEHPIINPFLPVTWQRSMSEQAIETVAIKWTPVNPMGYLLRAYGKGREFFLSLYYSHIHTLCCFKLGKVWHLPRPVKYTGNPSLRYIYITFAAICYFCKYTDLWSLGKYLCLCKYKARTMKHSYGKALTWWCFWTHRNLSAVTKNSMYNPRLSDVLSPVSDRRKSNMVVPPPGCAYRVPGPVPTGCDSVPLGWEGCPGIYILSSKATDLK